ncbi:restriction endonuclease subunit S [Sulfurimonas sp.]|uniref:restriction endonuclease subunit S n=1 Tax=Sulfurimonas sp. TaxID=2022749 RepID=UPI002B4AA5BF|nr:restriction endonuclease subunit S [Sulfurimonas sp.]
MITKGNVLREGWEIRRLKDVCTLITCGVAKKPNYIDNGIPFLSARNVKNAKVIWQKHQYISEDFHNELTKKNKPLIGDILYTRVGSFGEAAVIEDNIEFSIFVSLTLIKIDTNILNNYFLRYYLNSSYIKKLAKDSISGSGVGNLNVGTVRKFPISIPPLQEQEKIVTILDEAFLAIAKAKANAELNLQNAKELFESYLQGIFKNNNGGSNSETLDSICDLIVDCEHKTAPIQETGYPSIRTPNIGQGILLLNKVNKVSEETYKEWTRRAMPQADDLILAREAPAGNIAVIPKNIKVCLGQRTVLIRPKKEKFISKYLAFLILSKDVQKKLLSHSKGATVEHINMKDIRAFKIYNLPTIDKQLRIIKKIESTQKQTKKLESIYTQKLGDLEELKKSILQKAFNGELT